MNQVSLDGGRSDIQDGEGTNWMVVDKDRNAWCERKTMLPLLGVRTSEIHLQSGS